MRSSDLTNKIKEEFKQNSSKVSSWFDEKLAEDGPWHFKNTEKETLNCFMRHHLNSVKDDVSEISQYLNNDDEDDAWIHSVTKHVLPVVMQNIL